MVGSPKLPKSAYAGPLHIKPRKSSRGAVDNNLKKRSAWYQAIQNPAQGAGVKIPDDVAVQTGTIQCCLESSFKANAQGLGGWRTLCLHPNQVPIGASFGANVQAMDPTSTEGAIDWLAAGPLPTNDALHAYSSNVRVVSAALYVQPEVSLAQATGELILGTNPFSLEASPLLDEFRNLYSASIMPLNTVTPMKCLWYPMSKDQQTYEAFYIPSAPTYGQGEGDCPNWSLYAICNGAEPDSTFRVRLVVNYEFIPEFNAIDIVSANPSPCDSTDVDLTEAWTAAEPPTKPTSNKEMSQAPGASIVANLPQDGGESGFGMFADVVREVLPFALEGLSMLL